MFTNETKKLADQAIHKGFFTLGDMANSLEEFWRVIPLELFRGALGNEADRLTNKSKIIKATQSARKATIKKMVPTIPMAMKNLTTVKSKKVVKRLPSNQ